MKWKWWFSLRLFDIGLTVYEYRKMFKKWWQGLQAPYFMPHVWQAMLAGVFLASCAAGAAGAFYLLWVRGLL